MKKIIVAVVVIGILVLLGLRINQAVKEASKPVTAARPQVRTVDVADVRIGRLDDRVFLVGSLKPKAQVDVVSKMTGRLDQLSVRAGDWVQAGNLLAKVDEDEVRHQVQRAEAALEVANAALSQREADLQILKKDLERAEELNESGLIPRRDLDTAEAHYAGAVAQHQLSSAQIDLAKAELRELRVRLNNTRILAPISGLVGKRYLDNGALVNPSLPVISLVDLSTMVMLINVPERNLVKIRSNFEADVAVDAFPERKFKGRVVRISPILDAATRTGLVEIEVPNPDLSLKAEMFARVEMDLGSRHGALVIPRDALVTRDQQKGVFKIQDDTARFFAIEAGVVQGSDLEVLSGLQEGEVVITLGANLLKEGDKVQLKGKGSQSTARRTQ